MEKGNLFAKTIELLTRFAQRLLQGSYYVQWRNGDCDLLIYDYIISRHISNLTSEIRCPKFGLSFQSTKNVSLDRDVLWKSRPRSFMLINVV